MGRFEVHGPFNGARFRDEFLLPALRRGEDVAVDFTGLRGKAPSFLDEAFGTLVEHGFSVKDLKEHLQILSGDDTSVAGEVWRYINERAAKLQTAH
jgi:hypothetical protein